MQLIARKKISEEAVKAANKSSRWMLVFAAINMGPAQLSVTEVGERSINLPYAAFAGVCRSRA
jgi:hypothetical protein